MRVQTEDIKSVRPGWLTCSNKGGDDCCPELMEVHKAPQPGSTEQYKAPNK